MIVYEKDLRVLIFANLKFFVLLVSTQDYYNIETFFAPVRKNLSVKRFLLKN